jgi:AbrB family looped-hinge helix DNA binding protein
VLLFQQEATPMILSKIKLKNQITIPAEIVKLLGLKQNDLVSFEMKKGQIILIPVQVEPKYTPEELAAIDQIVAREKDKGKAYKAGREFQKAIDEL